MITNERLKALRLEAGLTQVQVAKMLGIEGRSYQRLELDPPLPSTKNLMILADYYNVSIDFLLGRTDRREINH